MLVSRRYCTTYFDLDGNPIPCRSVPIDVARASGGGDDDEDAGDDDGGVVGSSCGVDDWSSSSCKKRNKFLWRSRPSFFSSFLQLLRRPPWRLSLRFPAFSTKNGAKSLVFSATKKASWRPTAPSSFARLRCNSALVLPPPDLNYGGDVGADREWWQLLWPFLLADRSTLSTTCAHLLPPSSIFGQV